eukprot:TRINITY_DN5550_c0_g1_i7.p1 TRINITY_DN5550_c0_g1~~TRINITY_DN5550_c0_g1_i7.p1  ORF type:complete len:526 (-),score=196.81 TRINITY_DN5550_c0_g1_i7:194-1771(-)
MEETRKLTNLSALSKSSNESVHKVNLEHALLHGDSLGGHHVLGHVDGIAKIFKIEAKSDGSKDVWIDLSSFSECFVVHKGSICLDGVSLTVAEWKPETKSLRVSLIHHTLSHTHLQLKKEGDLLNVEFDTVLKNAKMMEEDRKMASWAPGKEKSEEQKEWERKMKDEEWMNMAFEEALKGRTTTLTNPWVGCVLVDEREQLIGKGFHVRAGESHAEVNAVKDAESKGNADKLKGATAYVTLEPCHHHGRTPPCDLLLLEKGIKRVVVAVQDPDTRVSGAGLKLLSDKGLITSTVLEEKGKKILAPYLHHRTTGRPYVVLKVAISMDGKIACQDDSSQWITGEEARKDSHRLRAESHAILVGSGTALKDDPKLNVRIEGESAKPLRVLLDGRGRVKGGNLLDVSVGSTIVYTTEEGSKVDVPQGIERKLIERDGEHLNLEKILDDLGKRGIIQLMVEGGSEIHSELLKRNLVDKLVVYQGATIIGSNGKSWINGSLSQTVSDLKFWKLSEVKAIGNDIKMEYERTK